MGEVSGVIFYENMYSDESEEMVSMSNQALIRTDSGSYAWRHENIEVAEWETKISFSKPLRYEKLNQTEMLTGLK